MPSNVAVPATSEEFYRNLDSDGYKVSDELLFDPANRRVKVINIGCGLSGIANAQAIQQHCENVQLDMYDLNDDIGGIWLINRYPGAACDIPSHSYTYSFAPNPHWPRFFSYAEDIWEYLNKVVRVLGLRKYMHFNTEVITCLWNDEKGVWKLKLKGKREDGSVRLFEDWADILLDGSGILKYYKWPKIAGLENFQGRMIHSARWPKDYGVEEWKKDRVAVIGSGASSVQIVPSIQPYVKHMDVFVRSGVWFVGLAGNVGENREYSREEQERFAAKPEELLSYSKDIEESVNSIFHAFFRDSDAKRILESEFRTRMETFLTDKRLLDGFTPKFGLGCRRVTPGDPYMLAIQKENVDVHFTPAETITEDGVIGADGVERKVDTVICATGYDVGYTPRFPIIGKHGVDLAEQWAVNPDSYFGITIPGFPNFAMAVGPNWPIGNGSITGPVCAVAGYCVKLIKKLQRETNLKSFQPSAQATAEFIQHDQEWVKKMVWSENCSSWYKNNTTGRVHSVWPGSCLHFVNAIEEVRWEDYEFDYKVRPDGKRHNRYAYLGRGFTRGNLVPEIDGTPHWNMSNIDPLWAKALGFNTALKKNKTSSTEHAECLNTDSEVVV